MSTVPDTLPLGATGPRVFPLALGCMGMSGMYGPADEAESIATIHAALDAGVTLLDTGDFYGMGHNEMLIGRALRDRRDRALLSVKFGALRGPDGGWPGVDTPAGRDEELPGLHADRLGVDHIDIYRPARLDPAVPIEETVGAIAELVKAGYVRAHRPVGGRRRDDPPRARGPSDRRSADRVLADQPRPGDGDLAGCSRARHRRHRLRRALARPAQRLGAERRRATSVRTCRASPARTASATSALVEALRSVADEQGVSVRSWPSPGCWRRAGHRAGDRRAHAGRS